MVEGEIVLDSFRRLTARLRRLEEIEAIKWYRRAETPEDKETVRRLYKNALQRYFARSFAS